jgi:hypothetical protein
MVLVFHTWVRQAGVSGGGICRLGNAILSIHISSWKVLLIFPFNYFCSAYCTLHKNGVAVSMSICLAISEPMGDLVTDTKMFVLVRYSTGSGTTFEPREGMQSLL